jgi:hypothetical protein
VENEPEGQTDDPGTSTELAGGPENQAVVVLPAGLLQTLEGEAEPPEELHAPEESETDGLSTELAVTPEDDIEPLAVLDHADDHAFEEVAAPEEAATEEAPEDGAAKLPGTEDAVWDGTTPLEPA